MEPHREDLIKINTPVDENIAHKVYLLNQLEAVITVCF